jgi:hypothetical protein
VPELVRNSSPKGTTDWASRPIEELISLLGEDWVLYAREPLAAAADE